MQYGVDVASSRLDDLDKILLSDIETRIRKGEIVRVLDVGCGAGGLSVALAQKGALVTALDISDYSTEIGVLAHDAKLPPAAVRFIQSDLVTFLTESREIFNIVVLQRVLHYVPYKEAVITLQMLQSQADSLYLSVTGAETAIAAHYNAMQTPIEARWGTLDALGQKLFSITAPLCLYHESELMTLLVSTGWNVQWSRVSDFGNIKVVAHKTP